MPIHSSEICPGVWNALPQTVFVLVLCYAFVTEHMSLDHDRKCFLHLKIKNVWMVHDMFINIDLDIQF